MADNSVLADLRANRSRPTVDVRSDSLISTPIENIDIKVLQTRIAELEKAQPTTRLDPRILVRSPYQPRKYFDPVKRAQLTASIKEFGVLENLIVRLVGDVYEIVAGERRQLSAIEAECADVPVFVMELSDRDTRRIALAENLVRQDLNPIEETWAILNLLAIDFEVTSTEEVKSILYNLSNAADGKIELTDNVVRRLAEYRSIADRVLGENLNAMKIASFVRHRLSLLNLAEDVLRAISEGLDPSKAKLIAKIEDPEQRTDLLRLATESGMSLMEVKKQVAEIRQASALIPQVLNIAPKDRLKSILRDVVSSKAWENERKWVEIERLLAQIEVLAKAE